MNHFYLYSYNSIEKTKHLNYFVIFCSYTSVRRYVKELKYQLREYFLKNIPPDEIYIIGGKYLKQEMKDVFLDNCEQYLDVVPRFHRERLEDNYKDSIYLFIIDEKGLFEQISGKKKRDYTFYKEIINRGMVKIFNSRGGLIVSQSSHHFVFPSGKHSDRFLRTGNVLIHGSEIFFIAFQLLETFAHKKYNTIYSDTSSINSLAFAIVELLKRYDSDYPSPHIESFGSYSLFEKSTLFDAENSVFLISSSTSGSIMDRLLNQYSINQQSQIKIIFGLGVKELYKSQVICDLSYDSEKNPEGISLSSFKTYNIKRGEECKLCEDGSVPVPVEGDVFLLDKPSIRSITIKRTDSPGYLKSFISEFKSLNEDPLSVIRCYFKENALDPDKRYEIFIDIESIIDTLLADHKNKRFANFYEKLKKIVVQNVPAVTKKLIVLPDTASFKLAKLIQRIMIEEGVLEDSIPQITSMNDLESINNKDWGALIVVSSCNVTGKNLLYLSRALRKFEKTMPRIFLTGINRTSNTEHNKFLMSNLSMGEYGKDTHKVINIRNIYCSNESHETAWHHEHKFIYDLENFLDNDVIDDFDEALDKCAERIEYLDNCGESKGMCSNIFFPHPVHDSELKINKGFAFADEVDFDINASQSDVYFIINAVINNLRHSNNLNNNLNQTEHVRNLISPGNFLRFNDGILQASILRSANNFELRYDLSETLSKQMETILLDMIEYVEEAHGEALTEFFYAIAIGKLRLSNNHLERCISKIEKHRSLNKMPFLKAIACYIRAKIINGKKSVNQ